MTIFFFLSSPTPYIKETKKRKKWEHSQTWNAVHEMNRNKKKLTTSRQNYYDKSEMGISTFFCFCFLGPHLRHMEFPRLGVESELQLHVYTTATATPDLSPVCLWPTLQLTAMPDPWPTKGARDQTLILIDPSLVHYHWATKELQQHISDEKKFPLKTTMEFNKIFFFFCLFCYFLGCSCGIWRFPG